VTNDVVNKVTKSNEQKLASILAMINAELLNTQ